MLDISNLFDESYYLKQNPDVLAAVRSGGLSSGFAHFINAGQFERRDPSAFFDTDFYLLIYPDIEASVESGQTSAIQHFINSGQFEERDAIAEFFTDIYLAENPDVAAAVEQDQLTAYQHFIQAGQFEGRDPGPTFDTDFYLATNPDVAAVVRSTQLSAIEHYLRFGQAEGRDPIPTNNAPDVTQNLDLGVLSSTNLTGFVGNTNPEDIYSFSLNATSDFSLTLNNLSADADVTLYEDFNDNGEIDVSEFVDFSYSTGVTPETLSGVLSAGDYFVLVEQFEGETNYTLSLSATAIANIPPDAAGNTLVLAQDIGTLQGSRTFGDFVGTVDTTDVYRFNLNSMSTLNITLDGLNADADLFLVQDLNGDGAIAKETEVLGSSVGVGATAEVINLDFLNPGTYYIAVEQFQGSTNYNLTLSATATPRGPGIGNPLPGFDPNFGFGLVNAAAAVARAIAEPTPFPDVPNPVVNNYGADLINVPEVWNRGFTGEGVLVAVLDTGIDLKHPDLQGNLWTNVDEIPGDGIDNDRNGFIDDVRGYDFANVDSNPSTTDAREEHGTHIAGIIAARRNGIDGSNFLGNLFEVTGIAYDATIMPIRVLNDRQTFEEFDASVAAGIVYAVENGAQVLNLSLGNLPGEPPTERIAQALQFARDRGVVAIVASGNERDAGAVIPADPAIRAAQDLALGVGAIDRDRRVAFFSNPAGTRLGSYDFVVAPGVDIRSAIPNNAYLPLSGTSMAAAHVSGVVALMLQANPNLTPADVERIFRETANPFGITV